ncbi:hypothetical protein FS749_010436 [Ceratobasidium sp. UAMH 11750]|nr:hypothetical protein FS749_010436 [Ceratobasidium sp. UAMH 11750]
MPTKVQARARRQRLKIATVGQNSIYWECPKCDHLILDMRGGRKKHEKACKGRKTQNKGKNRPPRAPPVHPVQPMPQIALEVPNLPQHTRSALWKPLVVAEPPLLQEDDEMHDLEVHSEAAGSNPELVHMSNSALPSDDWNNREGVPNSLKEGQVWIRRHPFCYLPSGLQTPEPSSNCSHTSSQTSAQPAQPPYYPFTSFDDFDQARILITNSALDGHITNQLQHNAHRFGTGQEAGSPANARELHKLLAQATPAENLTFQTCDIVTEFKGYTYMHQARSQSLWQALTDMVVDPDMVHQFVWLPEQRFVHSRCSARPTPTLEESWHGQDWWNAQLWIGPGSRILYIQLYVDSTHLSVGGGAKVWPMYAWLGNLPAALRKRHGKGGAALVGYLPVVEEDKRLSSSNQAELRVHVYQCVIQYILELIELALKFGVLVECSDGVVRRLYAMIGAISLDYEELMKMLALLGHQSGCPCPLCLVPRACQGDLSGTKWPLRTYGGTMEVHE